MIPWMAEHDTLAQRLGVILTKLNNGQRLVISELAHEFNVSARTIQRDLNVRLAYLPLEREGQTTYQSLHTICRGQSPPHIAQLTKSKTMRDIQTARGLKGGKMRPLARYGILISYRIMMC